MTFYYCERTSVDLFSEPINAISNISFILCGVLLFLIKKKSFSIFPYLVILIGISSFLFHIKPINLFSFLDVASIILFIFFYNLKLLEKILNFSFLLSLILSLILIICCYSIGFLLYKTYLGSSSFYIFLLVYMIIICYFIKAKSFKKLFFIGTLLFFLSLIFRTIDMYICDNFMIGSHFMWHILNSFVLYCLVKYILLNNRTSPKKPS